MSAGLYVAYGVVWLLIGVLAAFLLDRTGRSTLVVYSGRTDTALFGATPDEFLADPRVRTLRRVIMMMLASMLVASGILVIAVAQFGLRAGERWALIALTLVPLAVLPGWWASMRPYRRAGVRFTLGDIPPFMWVPTALYVPAVVLGWLALR